MAIYVNSLPICMIFFPVDLSLVRCVMLMPFSVASLDFSSHLWCCDILRSSNVNLYKFVGFCCWALYVLLMLIYIILLVFVELLIIDINLRTSFDLEIYLCQAVNLWC